MKLKLDLHVHTKRSSDAFIEPGQLAGLCKMKGLDGVAITDHNTLRQDYPEGIIAISGIEVSSKDGHVIGLGLSNSVPRGLSADETIRQIHNQGGVAIIPHPYDMFRSSVRPERLEVRPDGIEVANSSSFFHSITWERAQRFARMSGIPGVGGSDSHIPDTLGRSFTVVETDSGDVRSILDAIKEGAVSPFGGPIKASERFRKLIMSIKSR